MSAAVDNQTKSKIDKAHRPFLDPLDFGTMETAHNEVPLSDQMKLATVTYLSTAVPLFGPSVISIDGGFSWRGPRPVVGR